MWSMWSSTSLDDNRKQQHLLRQNAIKKGYREGYKILLVFGYIRENTKYHLPTYLIKIIFDLNYDFLKLYPYHLRINKKIDVLFVDTYLSKWCEATIIEIKQIGEPIPQKHWKKESNRFLSDRWYKNDRSPVQMYKNDKPIIFFTKSEHDAECKIHFAIFVEYISSDYCNTPNHKEWILIKEDTICDCDSLQCIKLYDRNEHKISYHKTKSNPQEILEDLCLFGSPNVSQCVGLTNFQNDKSWMNAILQCLFHTKQFNKLIMETNNMRQNDVLLQLRYMFNEMNNGQFKVLSSNKFKKCCDDNKFRFRCFKYKNCNEFLSWIFKLLKQSENMNDKMDRLFGCDLYDEQKQYVLSLEPPFKYVCNTYIINVYNGKMMNKHFMELRADKCYFVDLALKICALYKIANYKMIKFYVKKENKLHKRYFYCQRLLNHADLNTAISCFIVKDWQNQKSFSCRIQNIVINDDTAINKNELKIGFKFLLKYGAIFKMTIINTKHIGLSVPTNQISSMFDNNDQREEYLKESKKYFGIYVQHDDNKYCANEWILIRDDSICDCGNLYKCNDDNHHIHRIYEYGFPFAVSIPIENQTGNAIHHIIKELFINLFDHNDHDLSHKIYWRSKEIKCNDISYDLRPYAKFVVVWEDKTFYNEQTEHLKVDENESDDVYEQKTNIKPDDIQDMISINIYEYIDEYFTQKTNINQCMKRVIFPQILILNAPQFLYYLDSTYEHNEKKRKIKTSIKFPIQNFDLTKYGESKDIFNLYAVICYYDRNDGNTHFYALIKNKMSQNEWIIFKDDEIAKINEIELKSHKNVCFLFYNKV